MRQIKKISYPKGTWMADYKASKTAQNNFISFEQRKISSCFAFFVCQNAFYKENNRKKENEYKYPFECLQLKHHSSLKFKCKQFSFSYPI